LRISEGSRDGFFSNGDTMERFCDAGSEQSRSDALTMAVRNGRRMSMHSFSRLNKTKYTLFEEKAGV